VIDVEVDRTPGDFGFEDRPTVAQRGIRNQRNRFDAGDAAETRIERSEICPRGGGCIAAQRRIDGNHLPVIKARVGADGMIHGAH
jgi:hypothetical protein